MAKKPKLSVASLPEEQRALFLQALNEWYAASTAAAAAVAKENELRAMVVQLGFKDCPEGTNTMDIGYGKELKCDVRINRKVDKTQYDGLRSYLDNWRDDGADPEQAEKVRRLQGIIDAAIALKPEVVVSGYKELSAEDKLLVGDVIIESLGTPGLKIHTPAK